MKCNKCEKPATFHITERVGEQEQWEELHLCEDCAREYLSKPAEAAEFEDSIAGVLAQQLKIAQTAEGLAKADQESCEICGITFYEFRNHGRLGCPHDYVCFEKLLEPLIAHMQGDTLHVGKRPKRASHDVDKQTQLIRLRREMRDAIQAEDYERASVLRDEIHRIECAGS